MSDLPMLPVPIVQMGLVEKLVEVEQNQPHVQQIVAQESARLAMKVDAERVPVVDVAGQSKKIRDREPGGKNKDRQQASGQSQKGQSGEQEDVESAGAGFSQISPWAGQIVNMKV